MVYNREIGYIQTLKHCFKAYIHRFLDSREYSPHLLTTFSRVPYSQISKQLDRREKTVVNLFNSTFIVFIMPALFVIVYFFF